MFLKYRLSLTNSDLFLTLILSFLYFSFTFAQVDKIYWKDGDLSLKDFNLKSKVKDGKSSELVYFLGYNYDKQKVLDTVFVRYKAYAYVDKESSWLHPEYANNNRLEYLQLQFDVVEYYKRILQAELDKVSSAYTAKEKFQEIKNNCDVELKRLETTTNGGLLTTQVKLLKTNFSSKLEKTPIFEVPSFSKRNFGYGVYIGSDYGTFNGMLKSSLTPTLSMTFGLEFAFKKSVLSLNASLTKSKLKQDISNVNVFEKDKRLSLASGSITYGYNILDKNKFKFTPYLGYGFLELSEIKKQDEDEFRLIKGGLHFGFNLDYKLRKRVNFIPSFFVNAKEYTEFNIRTRLAVTKLNFNSQLSGYSINLGISFSMFGNLIKNK